MAVPRIGGPGIGTSVNNGLAATPQGQLVGLTNTLTLAAGEVWFVPPGTWGIQPGPYTFLQFKDPVSGTFKTRPTSATHVSFYESDGTNMRLANTTGCVVGALITTGGASLTNGIGTAATGLTITASTGASVWVPVVGGAVSTTLATATGTTTAGSSYTYPPIVLIDAPPAGGTQATAICTALSSGTVPVASIQILNQGAGYPTAPNVTIVNDARDTTGVGAVVVVTLTGTGALTNMYPTDHGTPLTTVPTFTFSPATCGATAIMNFTVTAYALTSTTSGGSGYPATGGAEALSVNNIVSGTPAFTNPIFDKGLTFPRPARITTAAGATIIITTGQIVEDGGLGIQAVPNLIIIPSAATTSAGLTATVGGVSDTSLIQSF